MIRAKNRMYNRQLAELYGRMIFWIRIRVDR